MRAVNPASGEAIGAEFARSARADLEAMADTAFDAIDFMADADGACLAGFLEDYAARLESDRDGIARIAHEETALPLAPRLSEVEFNRMCLQLREAARSLRDESWREVARDDANRLRSFRSAARSCASDLRTSLWRSTRSRVATSARRSRRAIR
jgi:alpha-ketoglutaric semialdehyde dehydrogenase